MQKLFSAGKNWESEKATTITKKRHFHLIKRWTLPVKYLLIFSKSELQKSYSNLKTTKIIDFETLCTFLE